MRGDDLKSYRQTVVERNHIMISVADFTSIINQVLPEPDAGLLSGILFGTKMTLSPVLKNALQTTGTLHIIALSGMNITILTRLFFGAFITRLPRSISSILAIGVIGIFVWFVGPSPSIVRAAIMGCITLLAPLTGRFSIGIVTWGIAIASMIVVKPMWIGDLSFQLSGLASLGMIMFGTQPIEDKRADRQDIDGGPDTNMLLRNIRSVLHAELATTISAQVFTIPLILFTFGRISLISPITNVLIGWTIPIITVAGLCLCVCGCIWIPLAQIVGWFLWVWLEYLIRIVEWTGMIPFASIGG